MNTKEIDNYIHAAERYIDRTMGDNGLTYGTVYTGMAIANALLAIAGELRQMNNQAMLEAEDKSIQDELNESTKIWGDK